MTSISFMKKKDKRLGIAEEKRKYDLPLNNDESSRFLILLITLMTFLAVMALSFSFALGGLIDRWSSGLENKVTIEIPAEDEDGKILPPQDVKKRTEKILTELKKHKAFSSVSILEQDEIAGLLEPWLGTDFTNNDAIADIPIPGLISAEIHTQAEIDFKKLEEELSNTVANVHLDRHEDWLTDLLRLTGSMQFSSAIVVLIIVLTTVIAVAGAIRSRMAEYKGDVELLHLMGARDEYITKQFQRHARIIGLQGGTVGVLLSFLAIACLHVFAGQSDSQAALPELQLSFVHYILLLFVPVVMCGIASSASRYTVLRVLSKMP